MGYESGLATCQLKLHRPILIILSLWVELSAMKLYVIMMKVRNPPVMFCIGSTVPSQTHLKVRVLNHIFTLQQI